jgi:hypothetical protein
MEDPLGLIEKKRKEMRRIFWKDGRFVNMADDEVNPKPIIGSRIFLASGKNILEDILGIFLLPLEDESIREINSYEVGNSMMDSPDRTYMSVSYYKLPDDD